MSLDDRRRSLTKLSEDRLVGYLDVYQRISSHCSLPQQRPAAAPAELPSPVSTEPSPASW